MQQKAIIDTYEQSRKEYENQYDVINRKYGNLSIGRLLIALVAIASFYWYYQSKETFLLIIAIAAVALFFILMKLHQQASRQRTFIKTLKIINEEELSYLKKETLPFANGDEYKEDNHAYANDLDLFGYRSLYQNLNRTATQMGKQKLAAQLQQVLPNEAILKNQEAIKELSKNRKERQEFYALGRIANDNKDIYSKLIQWSAQEEQPVGKSLLVLAYLLPAILIGSLAAYAFTRNETFWNIVTKLFPINLLIFFFLVKRVKKAMFSADKVNEMLKEYSAMFQQLESTTYTSERLIVLQQKLQVTGAQASAELKKLASIFAGMETVQNPFSAVIMNGLYLHHIHQLHKLNLWKKKYATHIPEWLNVLGEMEMLNSLANLYDNNPDFSFPQLNEDHIISFKALGHPLISEDKRVCNDITFDEHRFIVLTGSNMSGKSTFLRTLGVNMVLAGIGSAICAAAANIHPLKIFVSMRQTDSLADSESYFFAEVKRLKYIMDQLDDEVCFVLLDEILRGTNSDDKRSGTIGVIEKIIKKKAIGAIATHDLEVCLTTDLHPKLLINKCFEVEIINDELVFDYKLRNGICKNKSATFLMKKMEIIA
jgi:AcrR family transcriptional regulator